MPIFECSRDCSRLVSVSSIPGGNPAALAEPDAYALAYLKCAGCSKMVCDRCAQDAPAASPDTPCAGCGGGLAWAGVEPVGGFPQAASAQNPGLLEAVSLWFALASLSIAGADGQIDDSEMRGWKASCERMKLPNVWDRFGLDGLKKMINKRGAVGAAVQTIPKTRRVNLCRELFGILMADEKIDPKELSEFLRAVEEVGVSPYDDLGWKKEQDENTLSMRETIALWYTMAFIVVASADGRLDQDEYATWKQSMAVLDLPDVWERFQTEGLHSMINNGMVTKLGRTLGASQTLDDRIEWCRALHGIIACDHKVEDQELAAFTKIITDMDVAPSLLRLSDESGAPSISDEDVSTWFVLAFLTIAGADQRLDPSEMKVYDAQTARMRLPCMFEKLGEPAVFKMHKDGTFERVGKTMGALPEMRRKILADAMMQVAMADGEVSRPELARVVTLLKEDLHLQPEEIGLRF